MRQVARRRTAHGLRLHQGQWGAPRQKLRRRGRCDSRMRRAFRAWSSRIRRASARSAASSSAVQSISSYIGHSRRVSSGILPSLHAPCTVARLEPTCWPHLSASDARDLPSCATCIPGDPDQRPSEEVAACVAPPAILGQKHDARPKESSMRQRFRRLPPLLRALGLLALLFPLASLGVATWALLRDHQDLFARRAQALAPTFVLLSFACNWPVTAYNARFRHPARVIPWLDPGGVNWRRCWGLRRSRWGVWPSACSFPPRRLSTHWSICSASSHCSCCWPHLPGHFSPRPLDGKGTGADPSQRRTG